MKNRSVLLLSGIACLTLQSTALAHIGHHEAGVSGGQALHYALSPVHAGALFVLLSAAVALIALSRLRARVPAIARRKRHR